MRCGPRAARFPRAVRGEQQRGKRGGEAGLYRTAPYRTFRYRISPNSQGMDPWRWFEPRLMCVRFRKELMALGMVPERSFCCRTSCLRLQLVGWRAARAAGKLPLTWLIGSCTAVTRPGMTPQSHAGFGLRGFATGGRVVSVWGEDEDWGSGGRWGVHVAGGWMCSRVLGMHGKLVRSMRLYACMRACAGSGPYTVLLQQLIEMEPSMVQ